MFKKFHITFQLECQICVFFLSLFLLPTVSKIKPLKAQTINTTQRAQNQQIPRNSLPILRDKQPSTRPLPEPKPPTPLPPPEELLPPPTTQPSVPPETLPSESVQTITVKKFKILGSSVFSPEDFAKITNNYINRPISLVELFKVRSEITKLYVDNGYITSGAYIPPQKLQDGVVEIQVLESTVEDIKVSGTKRLNSNYVRSRIAIATGKPLKRERLLEALQLLQLNPLIENLSAELSAGTRPGESLLEIRVKEAKTFNAQVILDNGRTPSVGSFQREIQVNEANFLGLGDSISVSYANTDGSNSLDLRYVLPINPRNGTLAFNFNTSKNKVIEEPFNILDIESNSTSYEVTLRQPVIQKTSHELALGLTLTSKVSKNTFLDGEIPFPVSGSNDDGRTRVTSVVFFQEWFQRNSQQVFALRSQVNIGFDAFNATVNETGPDTRFFYWRGQAQWVRLLARDTLLLLRGDIQLADKSLVPFEQFAVGGLNNVRGYRQDTLLADNGVFVSAEARIPIARFSGENNLLQVTPFVDFGTVWNASGRDNLDSDEPNTLVSMGLGLRLQLKQWLSARLDWGIPLVSIAGDKNTLQENGIYFNIILNPF